MVSHRLTKILFLMLALAPCMRAAEQHLEHKPRTFNAEQVQHYAKKHKYFLVQRDGDVLEVISDKTGEKVSELSCRDAAGAAAGASVRSLATTTTARFFALTNDDSADIYILKRGGPVKVGHIILDCQSSVITTASGVVLENLRYGIAILPYKDLSNAEHATVKESALSRIDVTRGALHSGAGFMFITAFSEPRSRRFAILYSNDSAAQHLSSIDEEKDLFFVNVLPDGSLEREEVVLDSGERCAKMESFSGYSGIESAKQRLSTSDWDTLSRTAIQPFDYCADEWANFSCAGFVGKSFTDADDTGESEFVEDAPVVADFSRWNGADDAGRKLVIDVAMASNPVILAPGKVLITRRGSATADRIRLPKAFNKVTITYHDDAYWAVVE